MRIAMLNTIRRKFPTARPELSVIVCIHNMQREAPRTLHSLSRGYQRDCGDMNYEIVIADNGSDDLLPRAAYAHPDCPVRYLRFAPGTLSPVRAINHAVARSLGRWVCVMIDGARLLSPGVIFRAISVLRGDPSAIVAVHGFHLGPQVQSRSILNGYDAAAEDALLERIGWPEHGYRLFEISVFAGSSARGWHIAPNESTCLFMSRETWESLGGYDEGFESAGGGLANLDLFRRCCECPGSQLALLLGEGTFHQIHGGVTTGNQLPLQNPNEMFDREYELIRGKRYVVRDYPCRFVGEVPAAIQAPR